MRFSHTKFQCENECFDGVTVNEEADVRANAAVIDEHANVRESTVMTDDNDDDANAGNLDDILSEILGA